MLQLDEGSFLFYFISPLFPTYLFEQILFLGILFLPLPPLYVEFICTVHPNILAALPSGHVHTFILPSEPYDRAISINSSVPPFRYFPFSFLRVNDSKVIYDL
jgi:hypothetical protein